MCRTPALGGHRITCDSCGHSKHIYHSCGHSHCPLCQNRKRQLWQDKLTQKLLAVPYVHIVFTLPHQLNTLAKLNKRIMYNNIMRAAWKTVKNLSSDKTNIGGKPGMVAVLHTFGSDMKYHVHVHALVTFGGLDNHGRWQWPKRKKKIAPYRKMCSEYRRVFLAMLRNQVENKELLLVENIESIIQEVSSKRWNVRNQYPTADTQVLTQYLARYINRIAIAKSRLAFIVGQNNMADMVNIEYKDYRKQRSGKPAPVAIKPMQPLVAINQFLMHVLPAYFQKSRYYGIHNPTTYRHIKAQIPHKLKNNTETIRILFSIMKAIAGLKEHHCDNCKGSSFSYSSIQRCQNWIFQFIQLPNYRGPPKYNSTTTHVF